jgi:hypothetical protein
MVKAGCAPGRKPTGEGNGGDLGGKTMPGDERQNLPTINAGISTEGRTTTPRETADAARGIPTGSGNRNHRDADRKMNETVSINAATMLAGTPEAPGRVVALADGQNTTAMAGSASGIATQRRHGTTKSLRPAQGRRSGVSRHTVSPMGGRNGIHVEPLASGAFGKHDNSRSL